MQCLFLEAGYTSSLTPLHTETDISLTDVSALGTLSPMVGTIILA